MDKLKQFRPEDVTAVDEVPMIYSRELLNVTSGKQLERFIYKWEYWLQNPIHQLKEADWEWVHPCLVIIRSRKPKMIDRDDPKIDPH